MWKHNTTHKNFDFLPVFPYTSVICSCDRRSEEWFKTVEQIFVTNFDSDIHPSIVFNRRFHFYSQTLTFQKIVLFASMKALWNDEKWFLFRLKSSFPSGDI